MNVCWTRLVTATLLSLSAAPLYATPFIDVVVFEDDFESYTGLSSGASPMTDVWTIVTSPPSFAATLVTGGGGEGGSSQFSQFTGNGNQPGDKGGIERTFSLVPDETHRFSFYHNSIGNSEITVSLTNADVSSLTFVPTPGTWSMEEFSFIPSASNVTIRLVESQDNSNSIAPQVDSIGLVSQTFIPEPSTALLMVGGVALLGRRMRARRRRGIARLA